MKHIYNTITYAELNTKSDYCQVCGFDGEISIIEDDNHKLIWKCPCCGNTDQTKMKCSTPYLWLYWYTVLESRENTRNQRTCITSISGKNM